MIDRLIEKIRELHSPIVVGLDPRLEQIPAAFKEPYYQTDGKTPATAAKIILTWGKEIIDQVCDLVPAVKPQIAMYEQFGAPGIDCYIQTVGYAKSKGLVVIGDIKRGDIASTAAAYSDGHLGKVEVDGETHPGFDADFITVNPYMGYDSIQPYIDNCKRYEKGIFALVKTSNPNSFQIQDIIAPDGRPVHRHVGELVSKWGEELIGKSGFSSVGAVVGATHPQEAEVLREQMPHTFFLVPGYGAQGAAAKDLRGVFNKDGIGGIINSSRGITGAYALERYKKDYDQAAFAKAARAAVLDMRADLEAVL
ncbi:MAG: orotidine-5'-phosphate decarboxylase [Oscillospiraceae bacterium]|nr:orotidine-5'-phosphate decarboxylase [Oscillospiraceae bacterium]